MTGITLITPPESKDALQTALDTNPYLTSLPSPKPDILAPEALIFTSGTAEIFRFPEVQDAITQDFIVLPCDIVSELEGLSLLDAWLVTQSGFGGATGGLTEDGRPISIGVGGEKLGRRGGLGVWYHSARSEDGKKKIEDADFLATTPCEKSIVSPPEGSLRSRLEKVVMSMPMDTLNDKFEEENMLAIRSSLIRKHGRVKMKTNLRDAHVYLFPYWVKDFMAQNATFDSVSEDVLGWWAKATWQDGLADKLGLGEILDPPRLPHTNSNGNANPLSQEISVTALSTTSRFTPSNTPSDTNGTAHLASRVQQPTTAPTKPSSTSLEPDTKLTIPSLLAYIHPLNIASSPEPQPQITRVDTISSFLTTSLRLAKLPPSPESPSPLSHPSKVAEPDSVPHQARVSTEDSLIDAAVSLAPRISVKESVIGSRSIISTGARLQRCLLMESVEIGEGAQLTGCIVGRGARIEGAPVSDGSKKKGQEQERTVLWDCVVGHGVVVPWGTEARGETFVVGGALDEVLEGGMEGFGDDGVESENERMPVSER